MVVSEFLIYVNIGLGLLALVTNVLSVMMNSPSRRCPLRVLQAITGLYVATVYVALARGVLYSAADSLFVGAIGFWIRPGITVMLALLSVEALYWLSVYYREITE